MTPNGEEHAAEFLETRGEPGWMEYRAPHIGHRYHLCTMAESGEATLEQIKNLVKNPKFICKMCGRVAAKKQNLCDPVDL
jgi:hypothetical protein